MKLFSFFQIFGLVFLLSACEDALDRLSADELISEANKHYKNKKYKEAARFLEKFELNYPSNQGVEDALFNRAQAYFDAGSYAQSAAVFEIFIQKYPLSDKKVEAHKKLFYCFYKQINRYDRDYSLIENAFEHGQAYAALVYDDEVFEEAMQNLYSFLVHTSVNAMHRALDAATVQWIKVLWVSEYIIRKYGNHPEAAQAYFRMIEFFISQNSKNAHEDAKHLLTKMQENHGNTQWYVMAKKLINEEKEV